MPEVTSGDLYEKFHSLTKLGYTRFYEMLNKLGGVSLVDADFTGKGSRGRSRVVNLRYKADEIKKRL
jgi:cell division control protein 6